MATSSENIVTRGAKHMSLLANREEQTKYRVAFLRSVLHARLEKVLGQVVILDTPPPGKLRYFTPPINAFDTNCQDDAIFLQLKSDLERVQRYFAVPSVDAVFVDISVGARDWPRDLDQAPFVSLCF
jgi:hypothetical protein